MRKNETADEIIAEMRRKPIVFGYRDMNALADRLADAIGRERGEWKDRIKDVQEVMGIETVKCADNEENEK